MQYQDSFNKRDSRPICDRPLISIKFALGLSALAFLTGAFFTHAIFQFLQK